MHSETAKKLQNALELRCIVQNYFTIRSGVLFFILLLFIFIFIFLPRSLGAISKGIFILFYSYFLYTRKAKGIPEYTEKKI